ncbi:EamA family transporter [Brachybacterium sp. DNPG3]
MGLGLIAGLSYATYSWIVRRLMGCGIERAAAMGSVFGGGGLLLMPVLVVTAAPLLGSREYLLVAGYMALVPMFAGYVLFGIGLARITASTATTITLTEPAFATILAVLVVGEQLTGLGWAGLATIAAALGALVLAPGNGSSDSAIPAPGLGGTGAVDEDPLRADA